MVQPVKYSEQWHILRVEDPNKESTSGAPTSKLVHRTLIPARLPVNATFVIALTKMLKGICFIGAKCWSKRQKRVNLRPFNALDQSKPPIYIGVGLSVLLP